MGPYVLVVPKKGVPIQSSVTVGSSTPILLTTVSDSGGVPGVNKNRKSVVFQNQGAVTVFLGFNNPNVAISGTNTGYALFAGQTYTDNATDQPVYALAASSTAIVNVTEVS